MRATGERTVTILFCDIKGYSSLDGQQKLVLRERVLPEIFEAIVREVGRESVCYHNSWGDAYLILFDNVQAGVKAALRLRDGFADQRRLEAAHLPASLAIRCSLHVGDVTVRKFPSPLDGADKLDVVGRNVDVTARIEPVTPPGRIWATHQLFALLQDHAPADVSCDRLGTRALAKEWGSRKLYDLRRRDDPPYDPSADPPAEPKPEVQAPAPEQREFSGPLVGDLSLDLTDRLPPPPTARRRLGLQAPLPALLLLLGSFVAGIAAYAVAARLSSASDGNSAPPPPHAQATVTPEVDSVHDDDASGLGGDIAPTGASPPPPQSVKPVEAASRPPTQIPPDEGALHQQVVVENLLAVAAFYEQSGQFDKAIEELRMIVAKYPGSEDADSASKEIEQLQGKEDGSTVKRGSP